MVLAKNLKNRESVCGAQTVPCTHREHGPLGIPHVKTVVACALKPRNGNLQGEMEVLREAYTVGDITASEFERHRVRTPGRYHRLEGSEVWEREDGTFELEMLEATLDGLEEETAQLERVEFVDSFEESALDLAAASVTAGDVIVLIRGPHLVTRTIEVIGEGKTVTILPDVAASDSSATTIMSKPSLDGAPAIAARRGGSISVHAVVFEHAGAGPCCVADRGVVELTGCGSQTLYPSLQRFRPQPSTLCPSP